MSKGLSQSSAWALSIVFSVLLFAGIIALIMSVKPSGKTSHDSGPYGEIRADETPTSSPPHEESKPAEHNDDHEDGDGEVIRADDHASQDRRHEPARDEKKNRNGRTLAQMVRSGGQT
ncbi:hypothetical protein [Pseudobacteriovorax antillogorgiicola]|uniref:Uncharacterized protein n=1 Tax=Pseudobacteriovorax antillogorgiicola TaxID=1513793 RepID=A0A1Y6CQT5_9BACT|nr:hypothetical protein [Pseudobacteriovorax antillogorgiicola]TCS42239.1 hypothetical protein EDD56_14210 [Pseudobacteriovorax antillogorgiicola]SMF82554.1 hypothetical protein SAMN06296036_14210 [Pseudobacteriovorax antillogorgiicola]